MKEDRDDGTYFVIAGALALIALGLTLRESAENAVQRDTLDLDGELYSRTEIFVDVNPVPPSELEMAEERSYSAPAYPEKSFYVTEMWR